MNQHPDSGQEQAGQANRLGTEQDYRLLVESMKDYAILMLDPQGFVATWNEGARRLKGYEAEEIIGKHVSMFYPKEDLERSKPQLDLHMATEQGRFEDEGWRVRKDGTRFWANVTVTALRNSDGTLRGFGKVTRDITDRKEAEEAMAKRAAAEILEISTPVVRVWEGVLLAPIIGLLDSRRTQQLMERLLQSIVDTRSTIALVDITGVPAIDTQTARHLMESVAAVRLIGADVILTGIRPAIAQTLVHLGIDLAGINTRGSLAAGLRSALEALDLRVAQDIR